MANHLNAELRIFLICRIWQVPIIWHLTDDTCFYDFSCRNNGLSGKDF
ncbi:Uncharacterized protein dnm_047850 [Desulfonema magnum]|uniref:Uncharacterized protein n=1 Tax=Desulfonema magnum TaxID=45655 RepID=A0A975GQA4_9BACT|nr:Uncharacterized protein dnm_047850 [Desulfonema magnum]